MSDPMRRWLTGVAATLFGLGSISLAAAQDYPTRPVTMIVPFPAGGATDTVARYLAEQMRGILGQSVIIENVAGAAGSIGVGRAVRSPADGYTLSIGTSTTHMLTGGLYTLPFDLLKDLEPVILIGSEPLLVAGKKSLPASDLRELIAYLRALPTRPRWASPVLARQVISPGSHFKRRPEPGFNSCPIAAMRRPCRIFWRARSIS
jgi:tripartite-type tricarboxylate transporter receptor subunit TctC